MILRLLLATAVLAFPAFAADPHAGHGGGHDMDHMEDLSRFGAVGDPAKATRTVTIHARDISYDQAALALKAGETVKFVLINDGTQDHELGVGDATFFEAHIKMMAEMHGMAMDAMPNMVTAKPGETVSLAWTFTKAGSFEFACAMPGHYELGMKGAITVK